MSDRPDVAASVVPPPPLSSASLSCNPRADDNDAACPTHTAVSSESELQNPSFADNKCFPSASHLNTRDNSTALYDTLSSDLRSYHSKSLPDAVLHSDALLEHEYELESLGSVTSNSFSLSTDDTLHNTSSESDEIEVDRLLDKPENMGNQAARKTVQSDDDTPDETKTKCCEIPKKKVKDRNSRVSRNSRVDDLGFDTNEVYPFEGRTRSEQELSDPVELEPFDIVETDDIRFVPGAGTSAVIQSASEPRFQTIPEDMTIGGEHEQATKNDSDQTDVKKFYIEKGSKILEPGTSTAHSTFEFKQMKTNAKEKPFSIAKSPLYENTSDGAKPCPSSGNDDEAPVSPGAAASPASPSSSGNSSNQIGGNNSKNDIKKPTRKGKTTKCGETDIMKTSVSEIHEDAQCKKASVKETKATSENKRQRNKSDKQPAIRDSEIDRNIDNVLLLTQTMFSGSKTSNNAEDNVLVNSGDNQQEVVQAKYENVNRCVKLESGGLAIAHKDESVAQKHVNKGEKTDREHVDRVKEAIQITRQGPDTEQELLKYENVGVCVKLEATGLSIHNKELPAIPKSELPNQGGIKKSRRKASDDKEVVEIRQEEHTAQDKDMNRKRRERKASSDKEFVEISRIRQASGGKEIVTIKPTDSEYIEMNTGKDDRRVPTGVVEDVKLDIRNKGILHISDSGTLIIKSLPKPPSHAPSSEKGGSHYYENDIIDRDRTDIKVPYVETESSEADCSNLAPDKEKQLLKVKEEEIEEVPPPSPSTMDILAEAEEEEEEEFEEEYDEDRRRKSLEMFEFTENVCKRLSQLLERSNSSSEPENEDYLFESGKDFTEPPKPENIYETINEDPKLSLDDVSKQVLRKSIDMSTDTSLQRRKRNESSSTLKRASGESEPYKEVEAFDDEESDDGLPDYFQPEDAKTKESLGEKSEMEGVINDWESIDDSVFTQCFDDQYIEDASLSTLESFRTEEPSSKEKESHYGSLHSALTLPIRGVESGVVFNESTSTDICDETPTAESQSKLAALTELVTAKEEDVPVQFDTSGRASVTYTESDLDISEHRDDMSTDSMLADDEAEETMEILFTKTYTEPVEGAEVFLSCTVVNSNYRDEEMKNDAWISDEALEYFEANASDLMSTAFLKAKKEMKDIQMCLQGLRRQMEHFHSDAEDTSHPGSGDLVPDYFRIAGRNAVTD
ncbi:uncharacterized protein LOC128241171 [Mya arenaria]|uniref:uncharacterized protein LOC128241171 n=1 Tax=Mya arenaria TaxID=6604 RepID=UPI0022E221F2|nr:uncharacterized protein LOC128241171 [Mya arenaria]